MRDSDTNYYMQNKISPIYLHWNCLSTLVFSISLRLFFSLSVFHAAGQSTKNGSQKLRTNRTMTAINRRSKLRRLSVILHWWVGDLLLFQVLLGGQAWVFGRRQKKLEMQNWYTEADKATRKMFSFYSILFSICRLFSSVMHRPATWY